LIVVTPRESEQFSGEFFKPSCAARQTHRSSGKQVGLRYQTCTLIGIGLVVSDIDRLLAQALNKPEAY